MALFEGGPYLTADVHFDVLMLKLKSHFQNAKGHKVESRGARYRYCDFLVKVGTVTMSSSARGISVEVCYWFHADTLPCPSYVKYNVLSDSHYREISLDRANRTLT